MLPFQSCVFHFQAQRIELWDADAFVVPASILGVFSLKSLPLVVVEGRRDLRTGSTVCALGIINAIAFSSDKIATGIRPGQAKAARCALLVGGTNDDLLAFTAHSDAVRLRRIR